MCIKGICTCRPFHHEENEQCIKSRGREQFVSKLKRVHYLTSKITVMLPSNFFSSFLFCEHCFQAVNTWLKKATLNVFCVNSKYRTLIEAKGPSNKVNSS